MTSSPQRLSLAAILSACIAYGIGMGLTLPLLSLILERMGEPGSVNGLNLATAGLASLAITPQKRQAKKYPSKKTRPKIKGSPIKQITPNQPR